MSQKKNVPPQDLYETIHRLLNAKTVQQALETVAPLALEMSGAHLVAFRFLDAEGRVLNGNALARTGQPLPETLAPWLDEIARQVQQSGAPQAISGRASHAGDSLPPQCQEAGLASLAGIPLHRENGSVAGVLFVGHAVPHTFSPAELGELSGFGGLLAGVVEQLRLIGEYRQREADLGIVVETAHMMISTLDLNELLQTVAIRLAWVSGMEACAISSFESAFDRVRTLAHYTALGDEIANDLDKIYDLADYPTTRRAIEQNEPLFMQIDDSQADPAEAALLQREGYTALLMLPLWAGDHPAGLVELYDRKAMGRPTPAAIKRLRTLAEPVALALVNARLYQSEREQRTLSDVLREISLALSSSLKASAILDLLLEQIGKVVPYDSGCVMLLENERVRISSQRGYERFGVARLLDYLELSIAEVPNLTHMAATLQPHYIRDVTVDPTWLRIESAQHIGSWVGAPLVVRDRLLGFLSLDKVERGFYNADHAQRLQMLASHAALALLNAMTFGEVEQASITDFLTGAFNHRYCQQQLRLEIERADRMKYPLSLLMLDLDYFKRVNDQYGHPCGDQVLKQLAARLKTELRTIDLLARYGGEEFAVILPGTPVYAVRRLAERLLRAVGDRPFQVGEHAIAITISVGGATYPDHAEEAQELIAQSDQTLYQAKHTGRNKVCLVEETQ